MVDGHEEDHYLGYLVLRRIDDRTHRVIDGQQRLTTLSLLVIAACRILSESIALDGPNADQDKRRLDQLRRTYIGDEDPVTLSWETKLRLNRYNDDVYRDHLVELQAAPTRGIRQSSRRMGKALEWFTERLRGRSTDGTELARFVDTLGHRFYFTVISVPDELKAYRVFETLNARGVQLSAADLLKNRLFALVHEDRASMLPKMEQRWEALVDRIGEAKVVSFLRDHWLSHGRWVRQRDLFRAVRTEVDDASKAFALLRALEADLDTWLDLVDPSSSTHLHPDLRRKLMLRRVLGVKQPIPLLLAARRQSETMFERLLKAVLIISIRYNAIGRLPPSEQEAVYARAAKKLGSPIRLKPGTVIRHLEPIYPPDDAFRIAFTNKHFRLSARNKKLVRYLLHAIEDNTWDTQADLSATDPTLEHMLPLHPGDGWSHVTDSDLESSRDRLGNLALLENDLNQKIKNQSWLNKREVLSRSSFKTTSSTATHWKEQWDADTIAARQAVQADQAVRIWRLEELS